MDRPKGLASRAVEDKQQAVLGALRNGINLLAVVSDGEQHRRSGKVFVEQIVVRELMMPKALSRLGIQRNQRVGKQVHAVAVATPEIRPRRLGGYVDDAAFFIQSETRPIRRASGRLVRIRRPRMIPVFTRTGNHVEDPLQFAAVHVVGPDRAGGVCRTANDVEILIDHTGRVDQDARGLALVFSLHGRAKVDRALLAEAGNQPARLRIQGVEVRPGAGKDPAVVAALPIDETALPSRRATWPDSLRIECPDFLARRRLQGDYLSGGRRGVEHALDD